LESREKPCRNSQRCRQLESVAIYAPGATEPSRTAALDFFEGLTVAKNGTMYVIADDEVAEFAPGANSPTNTFGTLNGETYTFDGAWRTIANQSVSDSDDLPSPAAREAGSRKLKFSCAAPGGHGRCAACIWVAGFPFFGYNTAVQTAGGYQWLIMIRAYVRFAMNPSKWVTW
jgi:hypothetical protein